jgi:hypothetical protein
MPTTIEATGKKWKAFQAIGLVLAIVGFVAILNEASPATMLIGVALFLGSRLGAWWMHGAIVLALVSPAIAGDAGSFRIDRSWLEHGYMKALVSYENTTSQTFEVVTIRCSALDGGSPVGTNKRSIFDFRDGPIGPGFRRTLEVPVNLNGARASRVECELSAR